MSASWPLPDDLAGPGFPGSYRADAVDEMTAGGLAVLAEVRRRIVANLGADWDFDDDVITRITGVVDDYAREILAEHEDDDEELPPALVEAARNRGTGRHGRPSVDENAQFRR